MNGTDGNDTLIGTEDNDILHAGAGDDLIIGGGGADSVFGGDGDDTLVAMGISVSDNHGWFDGGDGYDVISYETGTQPTTIDLNSGWAGSYFSRYPLVSVEGAIGSQVNDNLIGNAGDNRLWGGSGDDSLFGGDGNDLLDGGSGFDRVVYTAPGIGSVTVDLSQGLATSGGGNDTLVSIEWVMGSSEADLLIGDANANKLEGGGGNDTLIGGAGADTLVGGMLDFSSISPLDYDTVSYATSSAGVTITTSFTGCFGTGGDAEGDVLMHIEAIEGSAFNDTLRVSGVTDYLDGGDGDDLLDGGLSNDTLIGGNGNDTLLGGSGFNPVNGLVNYADTLFGGNGNDSLDGGDGDDLLEGGDGNDTLFGGAGFDLFNAVDTVGHDILYGGDGDDLLEGGNGSDTLQGGAGNDTASYALSASGVTVNLETGSGTGSDAEGDVLSGIENLAGSSHADALTGSSGSNRLDGAAGNDTLIGGDGDDTLDGGTGNDSLVGGMGNDVYIVDSAGDIVRESLHSGVDEVRTTLNTQTLGANLERLTFIGTGDFKGTGNALDNLIVGGAGNDTLIGGTGFDTLIGGDGDDRFYFDHDDAPLQGGAGFDTAVLQSSIGVSLDLVACSIEQAYGGTGNDTLIGTGSLVGLALNGRDGNDQLVGSAFNDTLTGGSGTDRLVGNDGDDVFYIDAADMVEGGAGFDTVYVQGTDDLTFSFNAFGSSGIERLISGGGNDHVFAGETAVAVEVNGGVGNDALSGSAFNDTLRGDAGDDTLFGGEGDDVLVGGAGDNMLFGGDGNDRLYVDTATVARLDGDAGDDTVYARYAGGVTLDLSGSIEHFIGSAGDDSVTAAGSYFPVELNGGNGNDRLVGSHGNDTLLGGNGNDTLLGGDGDDLLVGGAGADVFDFSTSNGNDILKDFNAAQGDRIGLTVNQTYTLDANARGDAVLSVHGFGTSALVTFTGVRFTDVSNSWFTVV